MSLPLLAILVSFSGDSGFCLETIGSVCTSDDDDDNNEKESKTRRRKMMATRTIEITNFINTILCLFTQIGIKSDLIPFTIRSRKSEKMLGRNTENTGHKKVFNFFFYFFP